MIDVSKIDLLEECESFIAGTINPFFKQNDRLWDLMYDLDNNEFILSSQLPGDDIEFKIQLYQKMPNFYLIYNYHYSIITMI